MENATKALIIAGGILIVLLVISLIILSANRLSAYFQEDHEAKILKQTIEFNNKFQNYQNQTIRGNEVISILNKIIDYNNMQSDTNGYEWIKVSIDFKGEQAQLQYTNTPGNFKIINGNIENSDNDDSEIREFAELSAELTSSASGIPKITDTKLQKLSSEIHNIVNINDDIGKKTRAEKLTKILGYEVDEDGKLVGDVKDGNNTYYSGTNIIGEIEEATYKYYQLTQFKRALFKCTEVNYNQENGRVNEMKFEVVIENGNIKME